MNYSLTSHPVGSLDFWLLSLKNDINIDKYCKVIKKINHDTSTKFIIITHNPITMANMDRLYGVTMAETGISKLISVKLQEAQKLREVS